MFESIVSENDQLKILSHELINKRDREKGVGKGVVLNLKNTAGADIGKAVFEAVFYDAGGLVLDRIEKNITDLALDETRPLRIETDKAKEADVKSYNVKIGQVIITPVPKAIGDSSIVILSHSRQVDYNTNGEPLYFVDLSIRNVSDRTIATALFDIIYYDSEGAVLDTVRYKEHELKPNNSRNIRININNNIGKLVKSYNINLLKTVTADVEKVLLCRNEIRTTETGAEEIRGILKNISNVKTDVALIANFMDPKKEKVGTVVIFVKDIEPCSFKKFQFVFNPPEGETVKTYTLDIGDIIEEIK
jgi:hypothetical protein